MRARWFVAAITLIACRVDGPDHVLPDDGGAIDGDIDGSMSMPDAVDIDGEPGVVPVARKLAVGASHTCALNGANVRCWGNGGNGRLGYAGVANVGDDETPASAGNVNVGFDVVEIVAGNLHTCALSTTGAVRCWGWGLYGQLGYAATSDIGDDEAPPSAGDVDVGGTVVQLAAGRAHTCALLEGGAVRCWGDNASGQLGYGNTTRIGDSETPASAGDVDVGGTVVQVAAGGDVTCAVLMGGGVRCWGLATFGQLGYGNITKIGDDEVPASAGNIDVGAAAVQVAVGGDHVCVVTEASAARCWGNGAQGRLGLHGTTNIGDNELPSTAPNVDVGGEVSSIELGRDHTCAVLDDGAVRCWGEGEFGRLGYGDFYDVGDNEHPREKGSVVVGSAAVDVELGQAHTCARLANGNVRCWGEGDAGRLGYGDVEDIGDNETPASKGDVAFQ